MSDQTAHGLIVMAQVVGFCFACWTVLVFVAATIVWINRRRTRPV